MSNQCPATCHSYTSKPEAGFTYITLKEGEKLIVDRGDFNSLLFLMAGNFEITSEERREYVVRENHFVFCFRAYHYEITALTDVEIIKAHFITAGATCDMIPFNSIVGKIKKINYKFTQVAFNEAIDAFMRSIQLYLKNDMHCNHLHHAKIQEMFIIFKFFYTPQIQLRTFYNLFDRNQSFASLVKNNAPRVKTVEELADICGFSIQHFNNMFKQEFHDTPYSWMQKQRIVEIEHLLTETNVPLKSIIKMYSFTNHGHFALFCRKYLKKTPLKIRKEALAKREAILSAQN
ncbi:MAG: helix-turn-helix domain-containing protein [Alistipes sp.]|nr:helix-turn-helix domain-containing protein [Alistipes sp.]MBO7306989.1 helix-turn-helix domain-containing protein [Alistipes sp.]